MLKKIKNWFKKSEVYHIKVDTGTLPPHKTQEFIEKLKNELKDDEFLKGNSVLITGKNIEITRVV